MKTKLCILLTLLLSLQGYAQLFGPRQVIDQDSGFVRMMRTADFDQDGDADVAVATSGFIGWYKNIDGLGSFGEPIPIQTDMGQSFNLDTADIDNDGKIDLIVSFFTEDQVVWYRNLGNGNFSTLNIISSGLLRASGVASADLDGDNDLDLVLGVSNGSGLYWVENMDGLGNFSTRITIDASISQARTQAVGDIDGDGDMDILTNSVSPYVSWFENVDGLGSFTNQHIIDPIGLYENFIYLFDIDGDTDLDILSEKGDSVIWRENLDGLGNFSNFMVIDNQTVNPSDAIAKDLDNDGDLDIVSSFSEGNTIAWYENEDGLGAFGPQIILDPDLLSPRSIQTADIDGDGDLDVLSVAFSNHGRELVWYENLTILGVQDNALETIAIYPNPATNIVTIQSPIAVEKIEVYDVRGRLVLQQEGNNKQLDVSTLHIGLLFVHLTTAVGTKVKKMIKY